MVAQLVGVTGEVYLWTLKGHQTYQALGHGDELSLGFKYYLACQSRCTFRRI